MNTTISLTWTKEDPNNSLIFIDLNIILHKSKFFFHTYQKSTSLYQYISPNSVHPPGILKNIIYGKTKKYLINNFSEANFLHYMNILSNRLLNQDYQKPILKNHINNAFTKYYIIIIIIIIIIIWI